MAPVRDFDEEPEGEDSSAGFGFKLFGRRWDCRAEVNGAMLLEHASMMESDDLSPMRDGIIGIFEIAIVPDQVEAFMSHLNDPDKVVRLERLVEVAMFITEQYSESRPTQPSSRSGGGRARRGTTSRARQGARASGSRDLKPVTS